MKKHILIVLWLVVNYTTFAQWSNFASGNTNGTVVDFEIYNNELYAAGLFNQINGTNVNYIGKWNGSAWQQVGTGFTDPTHTVTFIDSTLFVARYEYQVDSNWIYYLSNNTWKKLGKGFYLTGANANNFYTCSLYDIVKYNGNYYACGEFNKNGTQTINGIAMWNGTNWQALGSGLSTPFNGQVIYPHKMTVFNNKLYVVGNFKNAGGITVNGVAAWDGANWSAVGNGFNSTTYALGVYNNQLYAGGDFTANASNTSTLNAIAKWNGTTWIDPGFGFKYTNPMMYNFVHSIETINNKLFIAGGFDRCITTGASPITYTVGSIIQFDGSTINKLAGGANNDIEALAWWQNKLVVGGFFSTAGVGTNSVSANKIAIYDTLNVTTLAKLKNTQNDIIVYPNPSSGIYQLKASEKMQVFVYNLLGDCVKTFMLDNTSIQELNLIEYPSGIYVLWCIHSKATVSKKIIKK